MTNERLHQAKRVVVKVGSNILTARNSLNLDVIDAISSQICTLIDRGVEVLLVTSGAMAAGLRKMGMSRRPDEIPRRQAIAAIGQSGLMNAYESVFGRHDKKVAQILLTSEDLNNRKRYLNARNALQTLLSWEVVPIINENDTISVEEIRLGDNDNLAAMITLLMDADFLFILTDIDGLYTKDPRTQPDAQLIPRVSTFSRKIVDYADDIPGTLGTGGMLSKVNAAKKVTSAGIPVIVARGDAPDILLELFSGHPHGTYFLPKAEKMASRKCWIAYTLTPKGSLIIDDGAAAALLEKGKSLLPSGVVDIDGEFGIGAPVTFRTKIGDALGIGLVNYSAADIRLVKGLKSSQIKSCLGGKPYDEIIHRDNLVIT
ncbi:MAG: glutamate 5-kinase [Desulfobacteraceae bacterium]|nr:glutamate 5-kinase [Desulfobacteraceae bacterium]